MERIKIPKAKATCWRKGQNVQGTLHLTQYHIIFRYQKASTESYSETWIAYPLINHCTLRPSKSSLHPSAIRIRCRDFTYLAFHFESYVEARSVFENIKSLACRASSVEKLYAFAYEPSSREKPFNSWNIYDARKDFARMGISSSEKALAAVSPEWRISSINLNYQYCSTYPALLCVPSVISDSTLRYAAKHRSQERIPALTYKYILNDCTITRSAQPKVGAFSRNPQDEKLVAAIFTSTKAQQASNISDPSMNTKTTDILSGAQSLSVEPYEVADANIDNTDDSTVEDRMASTSLSSSDVSEPAVPSSDMIDKVYGAQQTNMIVDARPLLNVIMNRAKGLGTENTKFYKGGKKHLDIPNIHVMRSALATVVEAVKDCDLTNLPPDRALLEKSKWRTHIGLLIDGARFVAYTLAVKSAHVLLHCSDGWDRTSQVSALAQLCLDPYYRTIDGFIILVEKDWLSFGHRFRHRSGLLGSEKWFEVENDRIGQYKYDEDGSQESEPTDALKSVFNGARRLFGIKGDSDQEGEIDSDSVDSSPFSGHNTSKEESHNTPTRLDEISPIFHQFLDATYQLLRQYPTMFEFNERFLRRLLYHLYSCQYGTFLYDNECERKTAKVHERTRSVWDYFLSRRLEFTNLSYNAECDKTLASHLLLPEAQDVRWWYELFGRTDEEMNGIGSCISPFPLQNNGMDESQAYSMDDGEHMAQVERPNDRALPMVSERLSTTTATSITDRMGIF